MSEPNANRTNSPWSNESAIVLILLKVIVLVAVLVYPLAHYTILQTSHVDNSTEEAQNSSEVVLINPTEETTPVVELKPIVVRRIEQPSCPLSHLQVILVEICKDLLVKHEQCTPEDFHNLEKHKAPRPIARNNTTGEPRGTIVGCVAAGLLLTSLGAAFVELYKAKSQTPAKAKPPMSRKCSLADLTVLKHNRKELVRRESILEVPENGGTLKQLGFRPPPLHRRCSFPVGPSEFSYGFSYGVYTPESRRTSVESRRLSIIESRRSSIDCRKASIDSRRISVDNESPERRHWSRLVHRH